MKKLIERSARRGKRCAAGLLLALAAASPQAAIVEMTASGTFDIGDAYAPWGIASGATAYELSLRFDDSTAPDASSSGRTQLFMGAVQSAALRLGSGPVRALTLTDSTFAVYDGEDLGAGQDLDGFNLVLHFQIEGTSAVSTFLVQALMFSAASLDGSAGALDGFGLTDLLTARTALLDGGANLAALARPGGGYASFGNDAAAPGYQPPSLSFSAVPAAVPVPGSLPLLAGALLLLVAQTARRCPGSGCAVPTQRPGLPA